MNSNQAGRAYRARLIASLPDDWRLALADELEADYFADLCGFLAVRQTAGAEVYPAADAIFAALRTTPLAQVRVVIVGQDPYHTPGAAHGLSFSVLRGQPIPPSLLNIYKEIARTYGGSWPNHGDLTGWAEQGVLLLNRVLTVEKGEAGSHQGRGWESFTHAILRIVAARPAPLVALLWGAQARQLAPLFGGAAQRVLESAHPSPLSAYRGFNGCNHFEIVNQQLVSWQQPEIRWW